MNIFTCERLPSFPVHLQQRRLHLQRADLAGRVQHLHLWQTWIPAQSGKLPAEAAGSRPRRPSFGPVPPQDQHPGSGLVLWTGRPWSDRTERSPNKRNCGHDGVVWKALSDHSQSQLPQEMRWQQHWDTSKWICPGTCPGLLSLRPETMHSSLHV